MAWQNAPVLNKLTASQQGGNRGAYIWGIDSEYRMIANFQTAPGTDKWSGWSSGDWMNAPFSYELTAAGQNNGCIQVWAVGLDQVLSSIAQTPPACGWDLSWQPPRRRP
ncbi:MAG: hypothetical protein QOH25_155 [Acidobacteriota bacterium]|nr:hypothetical protein [Acidobacteriota bacterium]